MATVVCGAKISRAVAAIGAPALAAAAVLAAVLAIGLWLAPRLAAVPSDSPRGCEAAQHVTLPAEGWRIIADGTFVAKRRAVPGPEGTLLFNDRAGRARCLRPI